MVAMNLTSIENNKIIFIQGLQKTGSSTLVGILNCHPKILILYETYMNQTRISNYGNQVLGRYPEARRLFYNSHDIGEPYKKFLSYLEKQFNVSYAFFGDKLIDFHADKTNAYPTIFTMRDIRSWLCKEQIIKIYRTDIDVVPAAIDYLNYVVLAYMRLDSLPIWLEDIIESDFEVLKLISNFLKVDLQSHASEWWKKIGCYSNRDPKSMCRWYSVHPSSKVQPTSLDTEYELSSHPFWDEMLSIFESYYRTQPSSQVLSKAEKDVAALENLRKYSPLPIRKCYTRIKTKRFGFQKNNIITF